MTDLAARADTIASAFDLGAPRAAMRPAARGEQGRVWSLETALGRWAVKELWYPMTETAARDDVAFQQEASEAGVRLPQARFRPDGRVMALVGDTWVRVYAWVDLTEARPEPGVVGFLLARLHHLAVPAVGHDPWFSEPVGEGEWHDLVARAAGSGEPWAASLATFVPELLTAEAVIRAGPTGPLIRSHRDLGPDNVVLDRSGATMVLDWENSGPEVPARELAMTALDWSGEEDARDDGAVAFIEGYTAAGGPGRVRDRASFATALAVQGHLLQFYARRSLGERASAEDRERSAWRIRTILAQPVTLGRIDALLARLMG